MPVVGGVALRNNLKKFRNDIKDKKTVQALVAVAQVGIGNAVRFAPIEYSTLVNSRFIERPVRENNGWSLTAGFNVNYAVYLETRENWKPRPVSEKKGPGANMKAKPHFLRDGFQSPEARRQIAKTLQAVYKV